jgi:hypothetical protein
MRALHLLFSPFGRLGPKAFVIAVIVVDTAGAASQWLTVLGATASSKLLLFAAVQALLIWVWFVLHAKRLRDADRSIGLAVGAAVLYSLSVVLLLTLATAFFTTAPTRYDANTIGALTLILMLEILEALGAASSYPLGSIIVGILVALAFLPVIVAVIVTLWAATGASINEPAA